MRASSWGSVKKPIHFLLATTLPWLCAAPLLAQNLATPLAGPPLQGDAPTPTNEEEVTFAADTLAYDDGAEIVTATGNVRMMRQGDRLRADKVEWNQKTRWARVFPETAFTTRVSTIFFLKFP